MMETALIVAVPEAEALVGTFRERHDPSASAGCPAHITLLHPFRPSHEIGADGLFGFLKRDLAARFDRGHGDGDQPTRHLGLFDRVNRARSTHLQGHDIAWKDDDLAERE